MTDDSPQTIPFDPRPLFRLLVAHGADFVVIGGLAGVAHGSVYPTYDLDIVGPRRIKDLARIAAALAEANATLRGAPPDLPLQLDGKMLANGTTFTFDTDFGPFDVLLEPDGAPSYEILRENAIVTEVEPGLSVPVASLDHLIAMKRAAGREKDIRALSEYTALSDEVKKLEAGE